MGIFLKDLLTSLFHEIDERNALNSLDAYTQETLDKALEHVVEGTDSKIKLVPDYKRKLYKSIIRSLEYADNMIEQMPTPIDLNANAFANNPYIRAFFPSISNLKTVCNRSSELKEFCANTSHLQTEDVYAFLCMAKDERTVFGMQLEGDLLIKEVKQTQINFTDHRIQSPAEDEKQARMELKCCFFEGLVSNALSNISELRAKRSQLETEQRILNARLRSHRKSGQSEGESEMMRMVEDGAVLQQEEAKLAEIEKQLDAIGYITPEVSLEQVNQTLAHPEEFVELRRIRLKLDKLGIKHAADDNSDSQNEIELAEVDIKGSKPRIVTLAKLNLNEVKPTEEKFSLSS